MDKITDLNNIVSRISKSLEKLSNVHKQGLENARYLRGDNWSKEEREDHRKQGFYQAYSIPLIATKLNRILSIQRQNRIDTKCRGRGQEDELGAEVLNLVKGFTEDSSDYKWKESEVYQDGLSKKYGVIEVWVDYSRNPMGDIKFKKIPFNQFYWDTNSISYHIYDDATFAGSYEWISSDKVKQLYPEFDFEHGDTAENYSEDTLKLTDWFDPHKKLIKVCNHYEKRFKRKYLVRNVAEDGDFIPFDSKKEAEVYIAESIGEVERKLAEEPEVKIRISEEDFKIIPKQLEEWEHIVLSGHNEILRETHPYSTPPFWRYSAMFDDGEVWSLTDLARDPQKAFDRYTSMMDKATVKNIKGNNYSYVKADLDPIHQNNPEKLFAELSNGGKYVGVLRHDAIQPIEKQNDIRVESQLAITYQGLVEDILGGRTFQGLDNNQRQTATEIRTLEKNSLQVGNLYADNLARFKQGLARYLIEVIKSVYTPERTFRVLGESMTKKVLNALQEGGIYKESSLFKGEYGWIDLSNLPKPLSDCNVDVIIDDVSASVNEKEEKFTQLLAVNQIAMESGYPPVPFEFLLQYSSLDVTVKNGLMEYQEQANEIMQAKMKMQADKEKVEALTNIIDKTKPEPKPVMGATNGSAR